MPDNAGAVAPPGLDEAETRRVLVAQTARFTTDFLRWMEGRACDGLNYQRLSLLQALHCYLSPARPIACPVPSARSPGSHAGARS